MKKTLVVIATLFLLSTAAQAQMGGGTMGEGQQMLMMKQMMGQGAMMQDMMQMMSNMMKMQQRMMQGMKPAEKKKTAADLSQMMRKLDKMMADMQGMMSQGMMMQGMMGGTASAEAKKQEPTEPHKKTQEKTEAGVTVKVSLESAAGTAMFKVTLETHSVDLEKYKFEELVILRAENKEYKPRLKAQEGSGHHRSAVVEFDNPGTKEVEVVVKDVAGVKERVFKF